jgi:hypothetical protein
MKQRLKLAAAIVHDPKLLILDEPTNGMDPAGRQEMIENLVFIGQQAQMLPEKRKRGVVTASTGNHGQSLASGTPVTFNAFGASFTASRLLLTNPSTTDTQSSYVALQGQLGFTFLPALKLQVDGNNYVFAKPDGLSMNGAGMTLAAPSFPVKGIVSLLRSIAPNGASRLRRSRQYSADSQAASVQSTCAAKASWIS